MADQPQLIYSIKKEEISNTLNETIVSCIEVSKLKRISTCNFD